MIRKKVPELPDLPTVRRWKNTPHQRPGNSQARIRYVARQAVVPTDENGLLLGELTQRVEDDALLHVVGGYFYKRFPAHPGYSSRVVEKRLSADS
jgi:hypothetical protein